MPLNIDDSQFIFIPIKQATTPPAGLIECIKDSWWISHPEKGLAFYDKKAMYPQCNRSKYTAEYLSKSYPWAELIFLPAVFKRINVRDYCD